MKKTLLVIIASILLLSLSQVQAQSDYIPSKENLEAREWFQDAKFGLFVHWGVYSVLGDGEWVMNNQKFDKETYQHLGDFFNPTEFDPAQWVKVAKDAGMQYITFTSRHHDSFSMFDSKYTDWDIMDRGVYNKDIVKMLADECHKQDMALNLYYSHLDWYRDDYYPRGGTGNGSGRKDEGDWYKYLDFVDHQLTELLTNYGKISGIWFDGWWDKKEADWRLDKTYSLIHGLQSQCLVGNNHHQTPKPGEDFQMFERDLPGQNKHGYSKGSKVGQLPLETCATMNKTWGYNIKDHSFKSPKEIITLLVKAAGNNANLLLNIGPMPNGKIQQEFVDTLRVVGKWLNQYGKSIYGTRGGPVSPQDWGVTTQKDKSVYVHILNLEQSTLTLPSFEGKVKSATLMQDNTVIRFKKTKEGITLNIPNEAGKTIDRVIELKLK